MLHQYRIQRGHALVRRGSIDECIKGRNFQHNLNAGLRSRFYWSDSLNERKPRLNLYDWLAQVRLRRSAVDRSYTERKQRLNKYNWLAKITLRHVFSRFVQHWFKPTFLSYISLYTNIQCQLLNNYLFDFILFQSSGSLSDLHDDLKISLYDEVVENQMNDDPAIRNVDFYQRIQNNWLGEYRIPINAILTQQKVKLK